MERGRTLHPNLARIAASYDQLILACSRGELDVASVNARLGDLVARDDDGVLWRVDPTSGLWQRQSLSGTWVDGEPPTWGLPTPTGHELTASAARRDQLPVHDPAGVDPDTFISRSDVDLATVGGGGLSGSTLRSVAPPGADDASGTGGGWGWTARIILVVSLLAAAAGAWSLISQ